MYISKTDVEEILRVMEKFPEATNFELVEEGSNGIGTITTLIVHTEIRDIIGTFAVEISGVENW